MVHFLKFLKEYAAAIGVIVVDVIYLLPRTIDWLTWGYSRDPGIWILLVAIHFVLHIFLFLGLLSLVQDAAKIYRLCLLGVLFLIAVISIFAAFRDRQMLLFIFSLWYLFIFFKSYKRITGKNTNTSFFKKVNLFGFLILTAWVILDKLYVLH